jgi:hypothetical protein
VLEYWLDPASTVVEMTGGARRSRIGLHRMCALAVAVVLLDACSSVSANSLPDIDTLHCTSSSAPASRPSSLPALRRIASAERSPLHGEIVHAGHGRAGPAPAIDVHGITKSALAREVRAAARVACQFRTTNDAVRAGYVRSSTYTEGVGTHWTNWRLVDKPFDPTRPSMLLYGPRHGESHVVGFSYWVRTSELAGPDGFAGPDDHWHRHYGLCFDRAGLLQTEDVKSPRRCDGLYLNGSDIWMLHAWIVPGGANPWGMFAPLNPQLCSRSVPDILRCPGFGTP